MASRLISPKAAAKASWGARIASAALPMVTGAYLWPFLQHMASDRGWFGQQGDRLSYLWSAVQQPLASSLIAATLALASGLVLGRKLLGAWRSDGPDERLLAIYPADVEEATGEPIIGSIPMLPKDRLPKSELRKLDSIYRDSYSRLRAQLVRMWPPTSSKVIAVTGAYPFVGKSTTAIMLSEILGATGYKVLLVDCDLRLPSLHRHLSVDSDCGVSNLTDAEFPIDSAVHRSDNNSFDVICRGVYSLEAGNKIAVILNEDRLKWARDNYDYVIVDTSPTFIADALDVIGLSDGVIFVIEHGARLRTAAHALKHALLNCSRPVGIVFNKRPMKGGFFQFSYSYEYDYAEPAGISSEIVEDAPLQSPTAPPGTA